MSLKITASPAMTEVIEGIGRRNDWSNAGVLRRAIAIYKFCKEEAKAGNRICIFDANGVPIKEVVGF